MAKLLEKVIKDAMEDNKYSFGAKEVIGSLKNSKLIILSESVPQKILQKILETAKNSKVPTLNFKGSSVALGRLCGTQFRISAISLKNLNETNLKSILKEAEQENQQ
ncbi:MAG TPA: ribosomal L7Ae/L30e/S12e/Gadd45 family protein [Nitrosopumilaceae archaeon]|nr:ribosomal L7Ae/L30e/S12e/Gadd45 family protein [Nitrosopumilaceae archaeon]